MINWVRNRLKRRNQLKEIERLFNSLDDTLNIEDYSKNYKLMLSLSQEVSSKVIDDLHSKLFGGKIQYIKSSLTDNSDERFKKIRNDYFINGEGYIHEFTPEILNFLESLYKERGYEYMPELINAVFGWIKFQIYKNNLNKIQILEKLEPCGFSSEFISSVIKEILPFELEIYERKIKVIFDNLNRKDYEEISLYQLIENLENELSNPFIKFIEKLDIFYNLVDDKSFSEEINEKVIFIGKIVKENVLFMAQNIKNIALKGHFALTSFGRLRSMYELKNFYINFNKRFFVITKEKVGEMEEFILNSGDKNVEKMISIFIGLVRDYVLESYSKKSLKGIPNYQKQDFDLYVKEFNLPEYVYKDIIQNGERISTNL